MLGAGVPRRGEGSEGRDDPIGEANRETRPNLEVDARLPLDVPGI